MTQIPPEAVWAKAPRYCPSVPFPAYAYLPGRGTHPRLVKAPHLGMDAHAESAHDPERVFAYGVDLYHAGYVWEAHEAWEALWHRVREADKAEGEAVRALILMTAAVVKYREGSPDGTGRLLRKAQTHATRALEAGAQFPGWVNGDAFAAALDGAIRALEADRNGPRWVRLAADPL